jgi:hypothetical protein
MDITTSLKMDVNRPRVRADKDREVYWSEGAGAIVMCTEVPVLLGKTLSVQALRAEFPGVEATPSDSCSLREHKTKR